MIKELLRRIKYDFNCSLLNVSITLPVNKLWLSSNADRLVDVNEAFNRNVQNVQVNRKTLYIGDLTPAERKNIEQARFEYEIWKNADPDIPEIVSFDDWRILSKIETSKQRLRYLTNLGAKLRRKSSYSLDKYKHFRQFFNSGTAEKIKQEREDHSKMIYEMGANFIIQRIQPQIVKRWCIPRLPIASQCTNFKVVIDLSTIDLCEVMDQNTSVRHLSFCYLRNMEHRQPCNLYFTSVDPQAFWYKEFMGKYFQPTGINDYPITTTEAHFTETFNKNELVYLSPDAKCCLPFIDDEKVYVIGGLMDRRRYLSNATFSEAKRHGISSYRLPIERYVDWVFGRKYLDTDITLSILLDAYMTGNWRKALKSNLPSTATTAARKSVPAHERRKKECAKEFQIGREEFLLDLVGSDVCSSVTATFDYVS